MVSTRQVARSKEIQRDTGLTFHLATRFLPERVRHPTYVLYAFFRIADDIVDDTEPAPPQDQRTELERIRAAALGHEDTEEPVLTAFNELRERHEIDDADIELFLDAMAEDIDANDTAVQFVDGGDREQYLRGSAVAVAYMMLDVMDPANAAGARPKARALGEAFQLTNFLRDVREDAQDYGRVYLPRETLDRHGVTPDDILDGRSSPGLPSAVKAELGVAEARYRTGVAGIAELPADCRFPVLLATVFYAEYHRLIRQQEYDVLTERPELSRSQYLGLAARTWWHWRRTGDAETVFYRVSPIDPEPADRSPEVTPDRQGSRSLAGMRTVVTRLPTRLPIVSRLRSD